MDGEGQLKLLIIADDLTGSNDAGAQFAKRGIGSIVLVNPDLRELPRQYPVVVVNTESRHVPAEEAARRVAHVAQLGLDCGVQHFFKKTDSTLRGNIGAELEALLAVSGERSIPFVPAFPEMGRTTRAGVHFVHGLPIGETTFANDPLNPVRSSEVAEVLRASSGLSVTSSTLCDIALLNRAGCLVIDCESRDELGSIAEAFRRENRLRVLSGSAAFAEELPNILSLQKETPRLVDPKSPILLVSGSLNPRSLEQVGLVSEEFESIWLTPDLLAGSEFPAKFPNTHGANVLLRSVATREEYPRFREQAGAIGIVESELHFRVAIANGRLAQALLATGHFKTLIVLGGDTLMGISRALRWTSFHPLGELESGVTAAQPEKCAILVISKAGGFGDREVMRRVLARTTA